MVYPFSGFLLREHALRKGEALCLPFDCLTAETERRLRQFPVNAIHLEEPRPHMKAGRALWRKWRSSGLLERSKTAYFLLAERYPGGERCGLLGLVDLKQAGRIWPHERVYRRFIEIRKKHFLRMGLHLSPVFLVAYDQASALRRELEQWSARIWGLPPFSSQKETIPFLDVRDFGRSVFDGVRRRICVVDSASDVRRIGRLLRSQEGYLIADGHHRFTAAYELNRRRVLSDTLVYVTSGRGVSGLLRRHPPVPGRKMRPPQPPPLEKIMELARDGHLMPRKTTYFWPKVPCGLVYAEIEGLKAQGH